MAKKATQLHKIALKSGEYGPSYDPFGAKYDPFGS
jgi:hypothetical protein